MSRYDRRWSDNIKGMAGLQWIRLAQNRRIWKMLGYSEVGDNELINK